MATILETVLYNFIECNDKTDNYQFGFRKKNHSSALSLRTNIFGRWKASLIATTVVFLVLLLGVVTRFRKMPKALLICNGKLRNSHTHS